MAAEQLLGTDYQRETFISSGFFHLFYSHAGAGIASHNSGFMGLGVLAPVFLDTDYMTATVLLCLLSMHYGVQTHLKPYFVKGGFVARTGYNLAFQKLKTSLFLIPPFVVRAAVVMVSPLAARYQSSRSLRKEVF